MFWRVSKYPADWWSHHECFINTINNDPVFRSLSQGAVTLLISDSIRINDVGAFKGNNSFFCNEDFNPYVCVFRSSNGGESQELVSPNRSVKHPLGFKWKERDILKPQDVFFVKPPRKFPILTWILPHTALIHQECSHLVAICMGLARYSIDFLQYHTSHSLETSGYGFGCDFDPDSDNLESSSRWNWLILCSQSNQARSTFRVHTIP